MVDVRNIVTPMMQCDVRFHLVFVYIGLNCASLSVVLVFEAEQSYSRIVSASCGCGRIIRTENFVESNIINIDSELAT